MPKYNVLHNAILYGAVHMKKYGVRGTKRETSEIRAEVGARD
jgi:hypothetical protein